MHKFRYFFLLVLSMCSVTENLNDLLPTSETNDTTTSTIELEVQEPITTTSTMFYEECLQDSNKDRPLDSTEDLQRFLSEYDFYTAKVDGKFGPQTETALRKFQEIAKIEVDGKFGPETKNKMRAWTGCES